MRVSEETKPKPKNSRTKWILGSVLGLVVVLGVLYVAGYFVTGNRLPKDAAVAGIHLGGMNLVDAEETLKTDLSPNASRRSLWWGRRAPRRRSPREKPGSRSTTTP